MKYSPRRCWDILHFSDPHDSTGIRSNRLRSSAISSGSCWLTIFLSSFISPRSQAPAVRVPVLKCWYMPHSSELAVLISAGPEHPFIFAKCPRCDKSIALSQRFPFRQLCALATALCADSVNRHNPICLKRGRWSWIRSRGRRFCGYLL